MTLGNYAEMYLNKVFAEDYFFNRIRLKQEAFGVKNLANKIAKKCKEIGVVPYLHVFERDLDGLLPRQEFAILDTMSVLRNHSKKNESTDAVNQIDDGIIHVEIINSDKLCEWIEIFCSSFMVPDWRHELEIRIARNFEKLHLVICYLDKTPAGCAALFSTEKLMGLYCLGTLPQFRARGVASRLVRHSMRIAEAHGTDLFLQTLSSHRLACFYSRLGFRSHYRKKILTVSSISDAANL
jgi:N-acetylglutamate synthase-like GNAT family acetyltransferase